VVSSAGGFGESLRETELPRVVGVSPNVEDAKISDVVAVSELFDRSRTADVATSVTPVPTTTMHGISRSFIHHINGSNANR